MGFSYRGSTGVAISIIALLTLSAVAFWPILSVPQEDGGPLLNEGRTPETLGALRSYGPNGIHENLGQIGDGEASYHTDIPGGAVAFYMSRLEITMWMDQEHASIEMTFPGSNDVAPVAKRMVPGMSHYLIGNDPDG